MSPYNAAQVANFFLEKGREENHPITMLKLIKLCYIAHGWHLGLKKTPLFHEQVEAWQYGPVIPSLYHEFKRCGRSPINNFAQELDLDSFSMAKAVTPKESGVRGIMEKVWDIYKQTSGQSLINKTHSEGTPWKKYYEPDRKGIVIPNKEIEDYYADFLQKLAN